LTNSGFGSIFSAGGKCMAEKYTICKNCKNKKSDKCGKCLHSVKYGAFFIEHSFFEMKEPNRIIHGKMIGDLSYPTAFEPVRPIF